MSKVLKEENKKRYEELKNQRNKTNNVITKWIRDERTRIESELHQETREALGKLVEAVEYLQKIIDKETTIHLIAGLEARSIIKEYDIVAETRCVKALKDTVELLNDPSKEAVKRYERNAEAMLNTKQERTGLAMIAIGAAVVGALLLGALFAPATLSSAAFLLGCAGLFSATALSFWGYQKQDGVRQSNKTARAMQSVAERIPALKV